MLIAKNIRFSSRLASQQQRGAVMVVGLVMLLLMTVVGLAAIRGSGLQELMAGNMRDRNLAFQAGEAGLRTGEAILDSTSPPAFDGTDGSYPDLNLPNAVENAVRLWTTDEWEANAAVMGTTLSGVSEPPRYVIEQLVVLSDSVDFQQSLEAEPEILYRVTSRGTGGSTNSEVILQSTTKP